MTHTRRCLTGEESKPGRWRVALAALVALPICTAAMAGAAGAASLNISPASITTNYTDLIPFTIGSVAAGQTVDPHFKWKYSTGGPIYYSSPAIGPDGTIYVGTGAPFADPPLTLSSETRAVFALNPDGSLKWQYTTGINMFTPAVGANGVIYVQDAMSSLYALSATDGSLQWKYPLAATLDVGQAAPALDSASDNAIYIVADSVYAILPDASLKWRYFPQAVGGSATLRSSPAISADGTIYVGANGLFADYRSDGSFVLGPALLALNRTGSLKWTYIFGGMEWVLSSPALADDGSIIVGAEASGDTNYVYALWPDGTLKWKYGVTGGRTIRSSPTVDVDGAIYIGTKAGQVNAELLALHPDGTLKWSYGIDQPGADIYCTPTIGADGTIYFGAETGFLYALKPDGSLSWRFNASDGINWTSPAIGADGSVYIGCNNGNLYALRSDSLGLADSPWPKFRHDNANTGRVVAACVGDCGGDNQVTVDEILTMVNIALGNTGVSACSAGDDNDDGQITVDEILTAVNNALNGC